MVANSWRPDNQDKEHNILFPYPIGRTSMKSDRVFADPYSARLEFKVNDNTSQHQAHLQESNRKRLIIHGSNRTVEIDCEYSYREKPKKFERFERFFKVPLRAKVHVFFWLLMSDPPVLKMIELPWPKPSAKKIQFTAGLTNAVDEITKMRPKKNSYKGQNK